MFFLHTNLDIFRPLPSREPATLLLGAAQVKLGFWSGLLRLCSGPAPPAQDAVAESKEVVNFKRGCKIVHIGGKQPSVCTRG